VADKEINYDNRKTKNDGQSPRKGTGREMWGWEAPDEKSDWPKKTKKLGKNKKGGRPKWSSRNDQQRAKIFWEEKEARREEKGKPVDPPSCTTKFRRVKGSRQSPQELRKI